MTKDEALKLAHEALKKFHYAMIDAGVLDRQEVLNEGFTAATAIKDALAQHDSVQAKPEPEQEPVALPCCGYADASAVKWNPHNQVVQCHNCGQVYTHPPQSEQKPVAWRWENGGKDKWLNKYIYLDNGAPDYPEECEPLYTTPPQRTWEGLTNNDLQPIAEEYRILFGSWVHDFARAIEAKLKEKNT